MSEAAPAAEGRGPSITTKVNAILHVAFGRYAADAIIVFWHVPVREFRKHASILLRTIATATRGLGFQPAPSAAIHECCSRRWTAQGITTRVVVAQATHNLGTIRNQEVLTSSHDTRTASSASAQPILRPGKAIADIDEAMALGLKLVNLGRVLSQPPAHKLTA